MATPCRFGIFILMARETLSQFKKTKGFRRLVWLAVVLMIYALVGFLVLPAVIKSQLVKRLPEVTKRQVAIQEVKLNPFALSYTMRGFSLTETNGETFASLGELAVCEFRVIFHLQRCLDARHSIGEGTVRPGDSQGGWHIQFRQSHSAGRYERRGETFASGTG
jgi:hypothetical protein